MLKVGDKVKIASRETLERLRDMHPIVTDEMMGLAGETLTIKNIDAEDTIYILKGYGRRRIRERFDLRPSNKLFKRGDCICGNKKTLLINIQEDYICEDCVKELFKSHNIPTKKKPITLKFKKSKSGKNL